MEPFEFGAWLVHISEFLRSVESPGIVGPSTNMSGKASYQALRSRLSYGRGLPRFRSYRGTGSLESKRLAHSGKWIAEVEPILCGKCSVFNGRDLAVQLPKTLEGGVSLDVSSLLVRLKD